MDICIIYQTEITNYPDDRLASHSRLGWKLLEFSGPILGDVLYAWEQSILKALKESAADIGNTSIADKFDGFSEAWVRSSYPVKKLEDLMNLVRASEDLIEFALVLPLNRRQLRLGGNS